MKTNPPFVPIAGSTPSSGGTPDIPSLPRSSSECMITGSEPARLARHLDEFLAASDYTAPQPPSEREWIDAPRIGNELI